MSVSTSVAFFDLLKASEILSPEQLTRAENLIGDETDTRAAARRLVKADLLTRWQASQLLKGSSLLSLGKYVLLERLPWGSNHAVFLAKHPMMDRKVALNVLDRASSGRADSRETFMSDARAIATLDHRNLIHVFDIDEAEERCFLVMEYVEGRNLHEVVKKQGAMSIEVAADIIRQIADGLAHAHKHKLIHGGLRPTNVILEEQGAATIIDLGLSKFDDLSKKPAGDDDSKIISIADYLSPEQASGQLPTAAADIYSLGCIAFFLLAGEAPFARGSYTQRLQRHRHDSVPDIRKLRSDTPQGLAAIVAKMMAKEPGERYARSQEIVDELESWWSAYGPTIAESKAKPSPAAASSRPPVAAPPPPKKNGKPAPTAKEESASGSGGFPGIKTGGTTPKQHSPKPSGAPAVAPQATKPAGASAGAAAAVATNQPQAPSPSPSPEPKPAAAPSSNKGVPLPLILGGVGALCLLFALGGGFGAYLYFASSGDGGPTVAEVDDEAQAKPAAAGDGSEASEGAAGQSDGEENNANEQPNEQPALPVPGAGENEPDGSGSDPEADGADQGGQPDPEPSPPPEAEPPKNGGGNNKPPKDPGNNKPPKKENPFRSLAANVELPPISGEAAPATLGKIHLPEDIACYIDLLGGDRIAPKEKGVFALERARKGLADREWELSFDDGADNKAIVAKMELKGEDLQFQWMPAAADQDAAPFLINCVLNLRTTDDEAYLALRKPTQVNALTINLERPMVRERFEVPQAPDQETLFVEIVKVDGVEKVDFQPQQTLPVSRGGAVAWLGPPEDRMLGVSFATVMQRDLQLTMTAVVDGGGKPITFNGRQLGAAYNQALALVQQLGPQVEQMEKQKDKFKKQLPAAKQQLSLAQQTVEKFDKLKTQVEKANGATVHFRVYRNAGDQQVDIVQGTLVAEPPEEKKPASEQ